MPEETLFKSETVHDRGEVADYLRRVADTLDAGEGLTLTAGDQSVTMDPPPRLTFEVKAEREGPAGQPGELSVEFELEWDEDGGSDGPLEIE
ncbi:amphi-Trp domain-containing protein [Salinigranum halophilum]|jgi:amphi-Trp domain-containing protein|uniref:amphi-Trp domain-containing protein n=1 Tax=Salinigranum halophilum TaxID=2565931 RepID=UPI0010A7C087|nr:amphi-Trp domain-containing protein [Salinigranum halophilum]